jgi:hypothetical protein
MRDHIILPAAAVAGGAAGFVLRLRQWAQAYDPEQERFAHAPGLTIGVVAIFVAFAVVFLLAAFRCAPRKKTVPERCGDPLYMMLMAAGGFAFFGAGVLGLLEGMNALQMWRSGWSSAAASYPMALLLCGGLCLLSGAAVLATGKNVYRPTEGKTASLSVILPGFSLLVWIFATHQGHATNPIFLAYGIYLTAAVLLTLANYDAAGAFHGRPHPRRLIFCTLMGTMLAVSSLADGLSRFQMVIAAAAALTALGHLYAMLAPEHPAPAANETETLSDPEL